MTAAEWTILVLLLILGAVFIGYFRRSGDNGADRSGGTVPTGSGIGGSESERTKS